MARRTAAQAAELAVLEVRLLARDQEFRREREMEKLRQLVNKYGFPK